MTASKAANAPKKSKAANVPKSRNLLCGSEFVALVANDITVSAASETGRLRLARLATVAWAFVLFALAVIALHRGGRVVEVGLQIASVAYGALLGVFLLGVLTKRANQAGAITGMFCGFAMELYLWGWSQVAFTWWVAIGTCVTFAVGYAASGFWSVQPKT